MPATTTDAKQWEWTTNTHGEAQKVIQRNTITHRGLTEAGHTLWRLSIDGREDDTGTPFWVTVSWCSCGRFGMRHKTYATAASSMSSARQAWQNLHLREET